MSFRLRVIGLVMAVAVVCTGVTAWLTLRQASIQLRESAAAGQREVSQITTELRGYGLTHGTWDGVAAVVRTLAERTGQRIRLETDAGVVQADSDVLAGKAARPTVGAPILVDPRPTLRLPEGQWPPLEAALLATKAISIYRAGAPFAACLTRAGVAVASGISNLGVPLFTASGGSYAPRAGCTPVIPAESDLNADNAASTRCTRQPADRLLGCLNQVFTQQISAMAPQVSQVYLGAVNQSGPSLAAAPTVTLAVAVALVAILGAVLLSQGVLRPVRTLTGAARGLGAGDLKQRVAVTGRDEIAELSRSFNRMANSLQASEERQRRLIGDVAHELRTPLANVRGYLEAMRDGVLDPSPELLDSLHEEVLLQQRIVNDLQDLALAEAGALTYHRADVDLGELLETCLTAHRALAEAAEVRLIVETTEPVALTVDPDRIRQALGNLITNAVRATAPGGTVALALARDDGAVTIRVADTGAGIPADDVPHLFNRFWRADASRGRSTGGSGLGLAIARQIVADHQGTITLTSTVGVGTTFVITFPAG